MASEKHATLTEGDVRKTLRGLAIPMMFGIVFIIAVNLVDTYFVGRLGMLELAAMSFTFPVVSLVLSVALGLGIGTTSAVSRALGAGDERAVKRLTTHSLIMATGMVALLSVVGILTQEPVFRLLGAEETLIPLLDEYMTIWYAGAVFLVVPMVANGVMRATGDARTPALIMMLTALANLVLDPIFIFGWGPVPFLGLKGAAIATVIARTITLVVTLYILAVRMDMLEMRWPRASELRESWRKIMSVGVPAAITNALAPVAAAVMTAIVAVEGSEAVAGYGIGGRIEGFLLIAPMAVATALTPFVGQNWGALRVDRVDRALSIARRFVLLWGVAAWVILIVAGGPIARVFTDDATVIETVKMYLWLVPLSYGAHGLVSVASAAFNAVDRALRSTLLSALRSLAFAVPLAFLGGRFFGLMGVFGGIAAATLLSGVLAHLWLLRITRDASEPAEVGDVAEAGEPAGPVVPITSAALRRCSEAVEKAIDGLLDRVIDIDDITVRARPVNTLGFYLGPREIAHVHRNGHVDVHLPPGVHDQLIAEGHVEHHRHIHDASWVSLRLHDESDADKAAWLLRLGQSIGRLRFAGDGDGEALAYLDSLEPSPELRERVIDAARRCRSMAEAQSRSAA